MKIRLNISTCPNDTFMFDALVHKRIDTKGYEFDLWMGDIDELNKESLRGEVDVTKISYAVYPLIRDKYVISRSGSALGYGNGPLVVSKHKVYPDELNDVKIGLPGENTTASKLFDIVAPNNSSKKYYLFSDISEAINSGEIDAGVLIHEERFVYEDKGLQLVTDLGQEWDRRTKLPIPLGAIVIKNELDDAVKSDLSQLIADSVQYAFAHPSESMKFVKENARELSNEVITSHIKMFVNEFSVDITKLGERAVCTLLDSENEKFI